MKIRLGLLLLAGCSTVPVVQEVPVVSPPAPVVAPPPPEQEPEPEPGPRLVLQTEHTDSIVAVRLTRDDSLVFTAGADGALKLRDLEGRLLWSQQVGAELISADISADARTFGAVTRDGRAFVVEHGRESVLLAGPDPYVARVALSADGRRIVTADNAGGVHIWNRDGLKVGTLRGPAAAIWAIAISADGSTVAAGDETGRIRFGSSDGKIHSSFQGHQSEVTAVALDATGERLASAAQGRSDAQSRDGQAGTQIKLWRQGELVTEVPSSRTGSIRFADNGALVSAGRYDSTVRLWHEGELRELRAGRDDRHRAAYVDISSNGERVVTASDDLRLVQLWSSGQLERDLTLVEPPWTTSLAFLPDNRLLAGGWDRRARLWSADGRLLAVSKEHHDTVDAVAVSPDGTRLATGSEYTRLWDAELELVRVLNRNTHHAGSLVFDSDGKRVLSGDGEGSIHVWDIARGKEVRSFRAHRDRVYTLARASDGAILSGAPFGELKLWPRGLRSPRQISGHGDYDFVYAVGWSPDGATFASASVGTVRIWDRQGNLLRALGTAHNQANVGGLAFSPDGAQLAASVDQEIHIFRVADGEQVAALVGHVGTVYAVAWAPNGLLASGGREGALRLWCVASGASVELIPRGNDWLALAPDGVFAASPGARDLVLWVKDLTVGDELDLAARSQPEQIAELLACKGDRHL